MVFVFGVDVPLVELLLGFSLIIFIMLLEVTVVMIIMFYQMRRSKETTDRLVRLSHILLHITQREKKELEALQRVSHTFGRGNGHVKQNGQTVKVMHSNGNGGRK